MAHKHLSVQFSLHGEKLKVSLHQVIIMGATNRPQDLDSAILRRMPTRFHINQPVGTCTHTHLRYTLGIVLTHVLSLVRVCRV